jgi:hypothetical protein
MEYSYIYMCDGWMDLPLFIGVARFGRDLFLSDLATQSLCSHSHMCQLVRLINAVMARGRPAAGHTNWCKVRRENSSCIDRSTMDLDTLIFLSNGESWNHPQINRARSDRRMLLDLLLEAQLYVPSVA